MTASIYDHKAPVLTTTDPLTRSYQTNGTATGPFGRGTTHATQIVLLVESNQRIVRLGDGRRLTLTLQPVSRPPVR